MKKIHLVSAILIPTLLASNIVTCIQYKKDVKGYEKNIQEYSHKVKVQSKIIKHSEQKNDDLTQALHSKEIEIHKVNGKLNQLNKENERLRTSLTKKNERVLNIEATAYISSCKGCSGTTFSEYPVNNTIEYSGLNIVATDTTLIPLYSIIKIATKDKSIYAIVLDKGGAIKGNKLDLLVNTYDDAIQFGKQSVTVTILREGKG